MAVGDSQLSPDDKQGGTNGSYPQRRRWLIISISSRHKVPRSWVAGILTISPMNLSQAPVIWQPNSDWFPYRATLTMALKKERSWCIPLSLTQLASEQDAVGMEECLHQQIFLMQK